MKKNWKILQPDLNAVSRIASEHQCDPITAIILANRGHLYASEVSQFLRSSLKCLRSPLTVIGMDAATSRIVEAIKHKEKILVFGDYDVDGVTSTVLLYEFLDILGVDVFAYIPHRTKEGYGLQAEHVLDVALPSGIDLIITADCGSNSHEAVNIAKSYGIDVVVTDHHDINQPYPSAVAVVNPKRKDCPSRLKHLAGVGVAFYLLISLRKALREGGFWSGCREPNLKRFCDLVALGTVADLVPLRKENRVLVKTGLQVIQSGGREGINALMSTCCFQKKIFDSRDISFRLAPRLNAAGRMDHARTAFELLTTMQKEAALPLARYLDQLNLQRQEAEKKTLDGIFNTLEKQPGILENKSLVLSENNWSEGVLGIVASRLTEKFFRPVVLIAIQDGIGKGSARSIPGFHIYDGLCRCAHCLEDFGGHSMAAGIKLRAENIDAFKNSFDEIVRLHTRDTDFIPELNIDYELKFDEISEPLLDQLESLEPFGIGNPEPLFMARNVAVYDCKIVGKNHRRLLLGQPEGKTGKKISAIHFNVAPEIPVSKFFERIAFRMGWNRWNGTKIAQLIIEEAKSG